MYQMASIEILAFIKSSNEIRITNLQVVFVMLLISLSIFAFSSKSVLGFVA